jgi:hypothetical protein
LKINFCDVINAQSPSTCSKDENFNCGHHFIAIVRASSVLTRARDELMKAWRDFFSFRVHPYWHTFPLSSSRILYYTPRVARQHYFLLIAYFNVHNSTLEMNERKNNKLPFLPCVLLVIWLYLKCHNMKLCIIWEIKQRGKCIRCNVEGFWFPLKFRIKCGIYQH